jgi:hypothetical protein
MQYLRLAYFVRTPSRTPECAQKMHKIRLNPLPRLRLAANYKRGKMREMPAINRAVALVLSGFCCAANIVIQWLCLANISL